jgi:HPt (histidine-containing phosphotransfer) domain-containing protein
VLCAAEPEEARRAEAAVPARPAWPAKAAEPAPVLNIETLEHLRELGSSATFVEKLAAVFLADNSVLLRRVEQALAGRNYHEFRSLLHALKGSSASIGTDRLTHLCGRLDKLSDPEMRLQAPALLRMLSEELATARTHLERYLQDKKSSAS